MNQFILNPPFAVAPGVAVSLIHIGDMVAPESLVISLGCWTPVDLLTHWNAEIGAIIERKRDHCCIVSGIMVLSDTVVPTEWWKLFCFDEEIRIQYQVLNVQKMGNVSSWNSPELWWRNIPKYNRSFREGADMREISQWIVSFDNLKYWYQNSSVLLRLIQNTQEDLISS